MNIVAARVVPSSPSKRLQKLIRYVDKWARADEAAARRWALPKRNVTTEQAPQRRAWVATDDKPRDAPAACERVKTGAAEEAPEDLLHWHPEMWLRP